MSRAEIWEFGAGQNEPESDICDDSRGKIALFDNFSSRPRRQTVGGKNYKPPTPESAVCSDCTEYFDAESEAESEDSEFQEDPKYVDEWNRLQAIRHDGAKSRRDFALIPRTWESVFYISTMHNFETSEQRFFYCITVKRLQPLNETVVMCMYTCSFDLDAGEQRTLQSPVFVWQKRRMIIPYGELSRYKIVVELWKTHTLKLNTLHAIGSITLADVVASSCNFNLELQLNGPKESEKRPPVHSLSLVLMLDEVFDFDLVFESWNFTPSPKLPRELQLAPKKLRLYVPKKTGKHCTILDSGNSEHAMWSPGFCTFQGTLRQLKYAHYVAKVYAIKPQKLLKGSSTLLGTCIMSLKSVHEYPLCRGIVKRLTLKNTDMQSGYIQGIVRCFRRSLGLETYVDVKVRPAQPISNFALLNELDLGRQHLVVRLVKCENLPATNSDTNTSDPMVRVRWDGMVNTSRVVESTTSPVYNQNMYFPIHLIDQKELIHPALIQHSLPVDMSCKGPVVIEVWDHDEYSLDFLGGTQIPLNRLYTDGVPCTKSFVDGLQSHEADFGCFDMALENEATRQYMTRMYSAWLPLFGSTIATSQNPRILVEIYILPPMPELLYIPPDQKRVIRSDLMRDASRRWHREYEIWLESRKNPIFSTLGRRFPCIATNVIGAPGSLHSMENIPLCSLVQPIQTPALLCQQGEMLHWIANFSYKPDALVRVGECLYIESWQFPSRFLLTRRGGLHDRALLLCSCLLGLGYDAYVCKGTLDYARREHCWVMTRHSDGTVTFWETGNRRMYHLPNMWEPHATGNAKAHMQPSTLENAVKFPLEIAKKTPVPNVRLQSCNLELWGGDYLGDEKIELEIFNPTPPPPCGAFEQSNLPNLVKNHTRAGNATQQLVPYYSIEVVFNKCQVWGNLQSHNPLECQYNLNNAKLWKPFLKVPLEQEIHDIEIAPPSLEEKCRESAREITLELLEFLELIRAQARLECRVKHSERISSYLQGLFNLLEYRLRLDAQFDPGMPHHLAGWSRATVKVASKSACKHQGDCKHDDDDDCSTASGESDAAGKLDEVNGPTKVNGPPKGPRIFKGSKYTLLQKRLFKRKSPPLQYQVASQLHELVPLDPVLQSSKPLDIPREFRLFHQAQASRWNWYYSWEARLYAWQKTLGIDENHTLVGIPIHFGACNINEIQRHLMSKCKFRQVLLNRVPGTKHVIEVMLFPLVGGLVSTWVFIGCLVPWRVARF
ncbi:bifunctional C2 domain superfamily/C2 domain [Babesia duncani]|uniref:Bifunctional C2 domain superfamily/C2 domain n=1 Tax=Babesia duncani TaxID=323732 RepID=A0AAD9UMY4_9APIC|nr:bifunctional C2 domain superfamily/C2 domain [Babesia duncani]